MAIYWGLTGIFACSFLHNDPWINAFKAADEDKIYILMTNNSAFNYHLTDIYRVYNYNEEQPILVYNINKEYHFKYRHLDLTEDSVYFLFLYKIKLSVLEIKIFVV